MSLSELKKILTEEIEQFLDEKLSDVDYWMDHIEEGTLELEDAQIIVEEILPMTNVEVIYD